MDKYFVEISTDGVPDSLSWTIEAESLDMFWQQFNIHTRGLKLEKVSLTVKGQTFEYAINEYGIGERVNR